MIVIGKADYDCLAPDFSEYIIFNKVYLIIWIIFIFKKPSIILHSRR